MIEAINGIGHAAVATDPEFRAALAQAGFRMDPETGEINELTPFVGAFSARTVQIRANIKRYEADWRAEHPAEEPGPRLREAWDRRAWAGVLDHAIAWAHPSAMLRMNQVRRFADPEYAKLSLQMRGGSQADELFDRLVARGQVVVHASEAERTATLATVGADGALVVADTREQVAALNAAIRNERGDDSSGVTTDRGDVIGLGDRVATRRRRDWRRRRSTPGSRSCAVSSAQRSRTA